jgi:hypothetical protein
MNKRVPKKIQKEILLSTLEIEPLYENKKYIFKYKHKNVEKDIELTKTDIEKYVL